LSRELIKLQDRFANHVSIMRLICRKFYQILKFNNHEVKKWAEVFNSLFFIKMYINIYGKVSNIKNHQGNVNCNQTEMSPHMCRIANVIKIKNTKCLQECGEIEILEYW
jgi:hypothetical protein